MVMVRVSETYDLSTKIDKMGLVGIHTPTGTLISRLWSGLALQHKKFRFVKCDVAMACASMLPADPLQIGVTAGDIAPQDMFNPILYKAVSNESMNQFLAWLQIVGESSGLVGGFVKNSIVDVNNPSFLDVDGKTQIPQDSIYYSLLADSDGWRKAMPQAGLTMRGLVPLVYQVVSQYGTGPTNDNDDFNGNVPVPALNAAPVDNGPASSVGDISSVSVGSMRGPAMRMPAIDTTFFSTDLSRDGNYVPFNGAINVRSSIENVPPAYVAIIVLPPAKLNQLYYRLKVTWTIEFSGLRSLADINSWLGLANIGGISYGTDYSLQSQSMTNTLEMADTSGADIKKVMEGSI